jgi:hypothetical protein
MYECGRWPMPGGGKSVSICCPYIGQPFPGQKGGGGRLARRARARLRNPGPNGEAWPTPPFCDASACGTRSCGDCDPGAYAFPGRVRTVLEALDQMRADIDFAVAAASDGERAMRAPGAYPFADPSIAVMTKPGGPPPPNALPTAGWDLCGGAAAVALPSQNRQMIPGGTP